MKGGGGGGGGGSPAAGCSSRDLPPPPYAVPRCALEHPAPGPLTSLGSSALGGSAEAAPSAMLLLLRGVGLLAAKERAVARE